MGEKVEGGRDEGLENGEGSKIWILDTSPKLPNPLIKGDTPQLLKVDYLNEVRIYFGFFSKSISKGSF